MLARLLAQARGEPIQMVDSVFTDVPVEAWYAREVGYLAHQGIVVGRGDNLFAPREPITRREFAVLLARFWASLGKQMTQISQTLPADVPETEWAAGAIRTAVGMGWFQVNEAGDFCPDDSLRRAESVVILNRILGRRPNHRYITGHLYQLNTFTDVDPDHWAWYDILEAANDHIA